MRALVNGLARADVQVNTLRLADCNLTPEGGYALAEIIKDWHGIRHLDLRDNDLDDGAATALLKACGDESAPHCVLDLEGNEGISDEIFRRVDMARGVEAFFRS